MRALRIASRLISGNAVDGLGEQVGARVRHLVPALEQRRIGSRKSAARSMIRTPAPTQLARLRHRDAMRRGEEHDVAAVEVGVLRIG